MPVSCELGRDLYLVIHTTSSSGNNCRFAFDRSIDSKRTHDVELPLGVWKNERIRLNIHGLLMVVYKFSTVCQA